MSTIMSTKHIIKFYETEFDSSPSVTLVESGLMQPLTSVDAAPSSPCLLASIAGMAASQQFQKAFSHLNLTQYLVLMDNQLFSN